MNLEYNPEFTSDQILTSPVNSKSRGAYSILKENKIYALSNFSCGFVTETEANVNAYRFAWRLKNRLNRYFMDRYLRRDPIKYEFSYRCKCDGCSRCLDVANLRKELLELNSKQSTSTSGGPASSSLLRLFYNKLINKRTRVEDQAALAKKEKRKKELTA